MAVAIVGIVVGVLYARRRPRLVFYQEGRVVVTANDEDGLEVRWDGTVVPAFARTRIWVWNAGSLTLDRSASVPGYPLRFAWGDEATQVLDVAVLARSRPENSFEVNIDPDQKNSVVMSLEYLDARQGAAFEVLHSCADWRAQGSGALKGTSDALLERLPRTYAPTRRSLLSDLAMPVVLGLVIATMGFTSGVDWWFVLLSGALIVVSLGLTAREWRGAPPVPLRAVGDSKTTRDRT
ncbi:MAG TPA: hypothetical protein VI318_13400 [Baekduia sp.]